MADIKIVKIIDLVDKVDQGLLSFKEGSNLAGINVTEAHGRCRSKLEL